MSLTRPTVRFPVTAEKAYDYLIAPANRAAWQSSLRRVEDVRGEDGVVGQSWTDITSAGVRPRMELTDADRPRRWTERGTWRGIDATLTLHFQPVDATSCDVTATMALRGYGPVGYLLGRVAPHAVRVDLRSAAAILAG
ncbi:SRPBCC family protein [Nocardioides sp. R-C-SC26]|uniref:SRPBCC family protein n=1 Tax=Nocardioides sp. R-C-SC26 TaxID=2870414 RepID=UPI001E43C1F5|nr:SRPBCC family protein [Nocardioides sp. R-C-SC26]